MLKALVFTLIVAVTGALSSNLALAHEQVPNAALWTLKGQDASNQEECFLFVTEVAPANSEFYAMVLTSYSHDHEAPQALRVQATPNRPKTLSGTAENGSDQIAIFLGSPELDLRHATAFNLKWLHGNHFHTNRCVNLQVHED